MPSVFAKNSRPLAVGLGSILWILVLSATLVETDAYRFASIFLSIYGLFVYLGARDAFSPGPERFPNEAPARIFPGVALVAWLCFGWSLYVLVRFGFGYLSSPGHGHGSSEWLYAFPMFFPFLGVALVRIRFQVEWILAAFFLIALGFLVATAHWGLVFSGEEVIPLVHNNQIHGAVASGFLAIGAFYWFQHNARRGIRRNRISQLSVGLAPLVILFCLVAILGSRSKGVWLALAGIIPVAGVFFLFSLKRLSALLALGALVLCVGLVAWLFHGVIWERAGPTVTATFGLLHDFQSSDDIAALVRERIASGRIPESMNERLQIWYNALELFSAAPFFGHGNRWIELWDHTRYADVGYTLMHNGYLEILVRHGLFGLLVTGLILALFLGMVREAGKQGVISIAAEQAYFLLLVFFLLTILSNSNTRLAIGEAFIMLMGAVAFYCAFMVQAKKAGRLDGRDVYLDRDDG